MEERNLSFKETLTVEQFLKKEGVEKVDVKLMPLRDEEGNLVRVNGKTQFHKLEDNMLFFTYGNKTGAVSRKGLPEKPMISLVENPEGEQFYLLHNEGEGAPTVASLGM